MSAPADAAPFSGRTIAIVIAIALIAFAGFALLLAFAPQIGGRGHDGRGHALSVSGNGFAGLVALTDAIGSHALIVRDPAKLDTRALLVATPEIVTDPAAVAKLLAARDGAPTLIVLPKWVTRSLPGNSDWSQAVGPLPPGIATAPLVKVAPKLDTITTPARTARSAPIGTPQTSRAIVGRLRPQQRLAGGGFTPILLDADGRTLIGRLDGRPVFVLADPDLLDNQGLADRWTARQGWQVIDDLATTNEIAFDVTLNGFAIRNAGRNPLQLIFRPPFLAVTLIIVAAGLLAGLHGAIRFGTPAPASRAIAMGKRTLVDNTATLLRAARREHGAGASYAALTRDLAARATHAPARLTGEALDHYLDRAGRAPGDEPIATLAWRAGTAEDRTQLLAAAAALYRWRRNRT